MTILDRVHEWPVGSAAASLIKGETQSFTGDVDKVYELASVTKLLSAYGFFIAIEEGVFELDAPAGPEGATVRHLLAHASGVGFNSREQERPAGDRRIYSSAGFEILADAVALETGIAFPDYLKQAVLDPLGMANTELYGAAGHGARSTVRDLTKFAQEVLFPSLIDASTLAEATSVQYPELAGIVPGYGRHNPCPWGLGFEIKGQKSPHWTGTTMPEDTVGHFGQAGTYLWVHRASKSAMVALTDRAFGDWAKPLWSETNDAIWASI